MGRPLSPMIEHYGNVRHSWDFSELGRLTLNGIHVLGVQDPYGGEHLSRATEIGAPVYLYRNSNTIGEFQFSSFPVDVTTASWSFLHDGSQSYTISFEAETFDRSSTVLSTTDETDKGFSLRTAADSYWYCVIKNNLNQTVLEYNPVSATVDVLNEFHNQSVFVDIDGATQAQRFIPSVESQPYTQFVSTGTAPPSVGATAFDLVIGGSTVATFNGQMCSLSVFDGVPYYSQGLREVYQSLRLGHD